MPWVRLPRSAHFSAAPDPWGTQGYGRVRCAPDSRGAAPAAPSRTLVYPPVPDSTASYHRGMRMTAPMRLPGSTRGLAAPRPSTALTALAVIGAFVLATVVIAVLEGPVFGIQDASPV